MSLFVAVSCLPRNLRAQSELIHRARGFEKENRAGEFWGKGIGDGLGICNQRPNRLESQDFLNAFGGCGWVDVERWAGV